MRLITLFLILIPTGVFAKDDFEKKVIQAILDNPEVVLMAIEQLREQDAMEERAQQQETIAAHESSLFDDANTKLVKFVDYRCGYCARSAATLHSLPESESSRVRLIEFPILGEESHEIAAVALAVKDVAGERAYRAFHFEVFASAGRINGREAALRLAIEHGHDENRLVSAINGPEIKAELQANHQLARALGLTGTPAFVSKDSIHEGLMPIEQLQSILSQKDSMK